MRCDVLVSRGRIESSKRSDLADVVNIDLARCRLAAVSEDHRALFAPALARIAERTDVDGDLMLAPTWHFYRVTGDLLTYGATTAEHVGECAEAIGRLGVEAENVEMLTKLLMNLHAYARKAWRVRSTDGRRVWKCPDTRTGKPGTSWRTDCGAPAPGSRPNGSAQPSSTPHPMAVRASEPPSP
ncbi:hypothetical protein ACFV83_32350 [Streptomyces pharetrae]|uniref:hypothetical protein n=1 Tax=Streptomyces pharetrae TaxID=291370 RepID=UPI003460774C